MPIFEHCHKWGSLGRSPGNEHTDTGDMFLTPKHQEKERAKRATKKSKDTHH
jgi:hypothetical protein